MEFTPVLGTAMEDGEWSTKAPVANVLKRLLTVCYGHWSRPCPWPYHQPDAAPFDGDPGLVLSVAKEPHRQRRGVVFHHERQLTDRETFKRARLDLCMQTNLSAY